MVNARAYFLRYIVYSLAFLGLFFSLTVHAQSGSWWNHIENDRASQLRQELASGADPNIKTSDGQPAIMMAIQHQSWNAYDLLRQQKSINVQVTNSHDETPLMYLAVLGETERMQGLIRQGAQVKRLGWTPLHYAASKGHTAAAELLLSEGALVNSPAPDGTTPLMMAGLSGSRATAELLLQNGADVNAVNLQNLDAADWARSKNNTRLASFLDEYKRRIHAPAINEPEPSKPSRASSNTSQNDAPTGSNRYFDLKRFDEPVSP